MKLRNLCCVAGILSALLLSGCVQQGDSEKDRILKRCEEIGAVYYDAYISAEKTAPSDSWSEQTLSQSSIDAIEQLLADAGFDIMNTDGVYPAYLSTAQNLYDFWDQVQRGESARQEIIRVTDAGNLSYMLFAWKNGEAFHYSMQYGVEDGSVLYYEKHEILDWELTGKGNFYYRIYPAGDKHYDDYSLIRTTAPDRALYDMALRCIIPVGYITTNLFVCDWTEEELGALSLNDLWEYFYYSYYAEQFCPDESAYLADRNCYMIPAAEFEKIVMPYFDIDLETFREKADYNAQGDYYPWRQLLTNDVDHLWYYACTPEVTACRKNTDGTVTLTVEVLSTDLKTDCLFAHEVTIRPLENGGFQYVGNKVTYQTEYGLPEDRPRLQWNWFG